MDTEYRFFDKSQPSAIIKTVVSRRASSLLRPLYNSILPVPLDCKYILVYERPRFTLIAMNGNTIIEWE